MKRKSCGRKLDFRPSKFGFCGSPECRRAFRATPEGKAFMRSYRLSRLNHEPIPQPEVTMPKSAPKTSPAPKPSAPAVPPNQRRWKLTPQEARANANHWWQFATSILAELVNTAAELRVECLRESSPLHGAIDARPLSEFIDSLYDAQGNLTGCHPTPMVSVNVPDPVRGGWASERPT